MVQYDRYSQTWWLLQIAGDVPNDRDYALCVYVSKSPDPRKEWASYRIPTGRTFPDSPRISSWPTKAADAFVVTTNDPDVAITVHALERAAMLKAEPARVQTFTIPHLQGDEKVAFDSAIPATTTRKETIPTGMGLPIMRPVMKKSQLEVWTLRVRVCVCVCVCVCVSWLISGRLKRRFDQIWGQP
jgi:hypothetical protein